MPTTALTPFNQRMVDAREAAGLSQTKADRELYHRWPATIAKSKATIQRLETVVAEHDADPVLVGILADLYGVAIEDLSPIAAERCDGLVVVFQRRRKPNKPRPNPKRRRETGRSEDEPPTKWYPAIRNGIGHEAHQDLMAA